jgi:hypothetical protein
MIAPYTKNVLKKMMESINPGARSITKSNDSQNLTGPGTVQEPTFQS